MKMKVLMLSVALFITYCAVVSGAAIPVQENSDTQSNAHSHTESDKPTIGKIITVNKRKVVNKKVKFGDEVLTVDQLNKFKPLEHGHGRRKRAVLKRKADTLWTNGRVPYEINNDYSEGGTLNDFAMNTIRLAMNKIEDISCIKFVPKQDSDKDFLRIISHAGCWSYVGRIGGPQEVSIDADGCVWEDIIIHELLHALGFYHEQSRPDRDDHIEILWENIDEKMQYNFEKREDTNSLGMAYDVKSIMHYDNYAFSKNKNQTMRMKGDGNEEIELGGSNLTTSDIKQLNMLYQCKTTLPSIKTAQPSGTTTKAFPTSTASPTTTSVTSTTEKTILQCTDKADYCDIIDKDYDCKIDVFQENCMKTCKICNTDNKLETTVETTTETETTTSKLSPTTSTKLSQCVDLEDDCHLIDADNCDEYDEHHCQKTCGRCNPGETTATSMKTSTISSTTPITSSSTTTITTQTTTPTAESTSTKNTKTLTSDTTITSTTSTTTRSTETCKDEDEDICPYIDVAHCDLDLIQSTCRKTCGKCEETSTVLDASPTKG